MRVKTKKVGDWTLLEKERAVSFLNYAEKVRRESMLWRNYNRQIFGKTLIPFFGRSDKPRRVAIDIGANYGFMTHGLTKLFDHVHCFEISPHTRHCLKKNFGNHQRCTIHDVGLGSKNEDIEINFYEMFSGHSSVLENKDIVKNAEKISCPVVTLDSLNIQDVDFIKIDVEGYEYEVLQGAKQTLLEQTPNLLIELLNVSEAIKVTEFLKDLDYRLVKQHNCDYLFSKNI